VHWSRDGRDVRWFDSPMDENHVLLLNELYRTSGHPEWIVPVPGSSGQTSCSDIARTTARNVEEAAFAARNANARLIFALQPNIATTGKTLTKREQMLPEVVNKPNWEDCYGALRKHLGAIRARNYQLVDVSRSFGDVRADTELFVDSYHVADEGNRLIARSLAGSIDWRSIVPGPAVAPVPGAAPAIVRLDPKDFAAPNLLNVRPGGAVQMRIVTNRTGKGLLVVFDTAVLATAVTADGVAVSIPDALYATAGKHTVYLVDGMTGERSASVTLETR
jgi:hypothetical protein